MKIKNLMVFLVVFVLSVQLAFAGTVTRSFSSSTPTAGGSLTVSLAVNPLTTESFYAIDEIYPSGWTVTDISDATACSDNNGHVKCVLIQGALQVTYTYDLSIPTTATSGTFSGTYAFEGGTETTIVGSTSVTVESASSTTCGNEIVESPEICDGDALTGQTCVSEGFISGQILCGSDCISLDTSGCSNCGNNIINEGERCDGTSLDFNTCISKGFTSGTLSCKSDCSDFDTSQCVGSTTTATCGNNMVEEGEFCDGTDLNGETCASQGFDSGTLKCDTDCRGYDESSCVGGTSTKLQTLLDSIKSILSDATTSKLQKISGIASALATYFG